MSARLERRLRSIRYQLLKNYPEAQNFSSIKLVRLAQKIYDQMIDDGVSFNDPTVFVDQAFGVNLTWNVDGTNVTYQKENIEVADSLIDQVIPEIGIPENAFLLEGEAWQILGYGPEEYLEFTNNVDIGLG